MKIVLSILGVVLIVAASWIAPPKQWSKKSNVYEVLQELGDKKSEHYITLNDKLINQGKDIVTKGRTTSPSGKKSRYVSRYYSCTTCHNQKQEDPDLRKSDPDARLPYVKAKGIPFLQGTTFKGIVNRESWYNDDYVKKYGKEKIDRAHKSLRESIQLCAIECSQGRPMKRWEVEAVLAYMWSLQFTLEDIKLDPQKLANIIANNSKDVAIKEIKSHYLTYSPAHFFDAPPNKKEGYPGLVGDPERGKDLFDISCMWCHKPGSVSNFEMDPNVLDFRYLNRQIPKDSHFSLYQIIAYGTYALPGHRPYMPHYTAERMSKQEVEDLRAYIEMMAKK